MSVNSNFESFCNNLRISDNKISDIRNRYHQITKRINIDYWTTSSDTNHSLYVGSYGRGTEIFTSDIDMVVELPYATYKKFNERSGNGQSDLLQEVKNVLKKTYSCSDLKGDGQIISIKFSDGINFEILPCFINNDGKSYTHADSNNGGAWRITNPRAEIDEINSLNKSTNKNLKRLCRMARAWKDNCNVPISGILIDTLAYKFLKTWEYKDRGYIYYDWMSRDFFKYLKNIDKTQVKWLVPGSNRYISEYGNFQNKASIAYNKALEAIEYENKECPYSAKSKWREIYGTKFPS
ncbi:SMODS domain-containing nucleotidyltransferase [Clostridium perfringens]|uniref:SMODS domain-containing nucleotidyltransferase n=1 Tax=Clostridium perfringens TaxID=1502 RepID=UPI0039E83734